MPLSRRDLMLGSTAIVTASLVASPGTAGPLDRLSQIVGSPSISLDFAAGSYSLNLGGDTSSISGTVAGLVASKLLSVDRNAAAYAESTTGAWTSFSSNVLRVTNRGALIERAAAEVGAPQDVAKLIQGARELGELLVDDPRVALVSAIVGAAPLVAVQRSVTGGYWSRAQTWSSLARPMSRRASAADTGTPSAAKAATRASIGATQPKSTMVPAQSKMTALTA